MSILSSIRRAIRARVAPAHRLSCNARLWRQGLSELRRRGRGARESGAFLLGRRDTEQPREILQFAYYDDLDPYSLDTGIVRFQGPAFSRLWDLCERLDLDVVADVHTHPGRAWQSHADAEHPMIAEPGHFSLIVPHFAYRLFGATEIGIYEYAGEHRWRDHSGDRGEQTFYIGWWA
jgi:proteasome lid subunit RPN8/RPN11